MTMISISYPHRNSSKSHKNSRPKFPRNHPIPKLQTFTNSEPLSSTEFVSKLRIMSDLVECFLTSQSVIDIPTLQNTNRTDDAAPGLNISYVLDGILCPDRGLRPLDMEAFRENDKRQPLKVVTSAIAHDGRFETLCCSTRDFFDTVHPDTNQTQSYAITTTSSSQAIARKGLFASLEASMTVPGAAGPPISLTSQSNNETKICFDAFGFEPIPYRSPVWNDDVTHVLVLRSRPDRCRLETKPGLFETTVAKLYFESQNQTEVARYFENGGQQYRYVEDILTLDEGRVSTNKDGVRIPPPDILYAYNSIPSEKTDSNHWKQAHVLPIMISKDKPELSNLAQGEKEVLEAVQNGFAAAFDVLAPVSGVQYDVSLTGEDVAEMMLKQQQGEIKDAIIS